MIKCLTRSEWSQHHVESFMWGHLLDYGRLAWKEVLLKVNKIGIWKDYYYLNLTSYGVLNMSFVVEMVRKFFGLSKDLDLVLLSEQCVVLWPP